MPMQWYRVAIHTNEISVANQSVTALIENLGAAYRAAGAPDGVKVYHHRLGPTDHFYYLWVANSQYEGIPLCDAVLRARGVMVRFAPCANSSSSPSTCWSPS